MCLASVVLLLTEDSVIGSWLSKLPLNPQLKATPDARVFLSRTTWKAYFSSLPSFCHLSLFLALSLIPALRLVSSTVVEYHRSNRKLKTFADISCSHRLDIQDFIIQHLSALSLKETINHPHLLIRYLSFDVIRTVSMALEWRLQTPPSTCAWSQAEKVITWLLYSSLHYDPRSIYSLLLLNKKHLSSQPHFMKNNLLRHHPGGEGAVLKGSSSVCIWKHINEMHFKALPKPAVYSLLKHF